MTLLNTLLSPDQRISHSSISPLRLIAALISLSLFITVKSHAAESTIDSEVEKPRWFEVEIILYKSSSDSGLENESWATDTELELPEQIIDFLQPFGPAIAEQEILDDAENKSIDSQIIEQKDLITKTETDKSAAVDQGLNSQTDSSIDSGSMPNSETEETDKNQLVEQEIPFVKLDQSLLQLTEESKSISKNSRYTLLAHFSWRQPVVSKNDSTAIRIAGGNDFQQTFEYSGEKKLEGLEETEQTLDSEQIDLDDSSLTSDSGLALDSNPSEFNLSTKRNSKDASNNQAVMTNDSNNEGKSVNSAEATDNETPVELVALPWVPEIDGSILVYIQRNYLHIDSNLFYRHPGQQEVDIFQLAPQADLSLDAFGGSEPTRTINPVVSNESAIEEKTDSNNFSSTDYKKPNFNNADAKKDVNTQQFSENDFNWQYDGSFLENSGDKVFTEKLFNYPLKQTRRLRSTELHYFDHPLIGMLVIIRPYQLESEQEQDDSSDYSSALN